MNIKIELPLKDIIKEFNNGFSIRELGFKYGVSKDVIYDRLIENGIDTKKKRVSHRTRLVLKLWEQTHDKKVISNLAGCSISTVYNIVRKINKNQS